MIALGPQGTETYLARLAFASGVPENRSQTLAAWIPNLELTRAVQAVIAAWTLALVYRLRRGDARMPLSVALVGGLAASLYAHYDDLTMLGLAALLYLGAPHPRWTWTYLLGVVIAAEGFPIWGAGPVLAGELGALALLSVAALKHDDGDAEQHHAEGQHHTDLERDRQHVAIDGES